MVNVDLNNNFKKSKVKKKKQKTMAQLGRVCYIFGLHQANKTSICFLIAMIDPIFCNLWKTFSLSWYYLAAQG